MPLAPEHLAEPGAHPVGDDQAFTLDLETLAPTLEGHPPDASALDAGIDRLGSLNPRGTVVERDLPDAGVEVHPRGGRAPVRERPSGPREHERLPEPMGPQPTIDGASAQPVLEAQGGQLTDRSRGEAVAAGLVAGEGGGVGEDDVATGAGRPRRGG